MLERPSPGVLMSIETLAQLYEELEQAPGRYRAAMAALTRPDGSRVYSN